MLPRELPDDHEAARHFASTLVVHAQTEARWVPGVLDAAMADARRRGWEDIYLALLHALIIYSGRNNVRSTSELLDELEAGAERLGSSPLIAMAAVDRIRYLRSINGRAPIDLYATARLHLKDRSGTAGDRFAGLLNLALEFDSIGLWQVGSETIADAEAALDDLPDSTQARAALANNTAHRLLRQSAARIIENRPERADELLRRSDEFVQRVGDRLPPGWRAKLAVHRRTVESALLGEEVPAVEVSRLLDELPEFERERRSLLLLTQALAEQTEIPSPDTIDAFEQSQLGWLLRVRSLRLGLADPETLVAALERSNRANVAIAISARSEMDVGLAAMIEARVLAREHGELSELVATDPLTQVGSRRAWQQCLDDAENETFTLVLLDLDRFKSINDTYGHVIGDVVLQTCATAITTAAASLSPRLVARLGGDEFTVLFNGSRREAARKFVEELPVVLARSEWPEQLREAPTMTAGISVSNDPTTLIATADEELYAGKRRGQEFSNAEQLPRALRS